MLVNRTKRIFGFLAKKLRFTLCSVFIVFNLAGTVSAGDWVADYLHRAEEESDIAEIIEKKYGSSRRLVNLNGLWEAKKQDETEWKQVRVPGVFDFEGEVEFKRTFQLDSSFIGYSFQLIAFGINNRCTFLINNEVHGGHVGGHISFFMDLGNDELIIDGENEIRIVVDNSLRPRNNLPLMHNPRIARNYGGIFRDIFILAIPEVNIDDVFLKQFFSDDYKQCRVDIKTVIKNKRESNENNIKLYFEIRDSNSKKLIARSSHDTFLSDKFVLQLDKSINIKNVEMWSPDNPLLFELRVYLSQKKNILDEVNLKVGFSEFRISEDTFLLNGQPFILHGIDWLENYPETGPAAGWKTIKEEVSRIKELGVNAIRVIGSPPHPYFLDICDELGLLVLLEFPLSLIPDVRFHEREFVETATNYFQEVLKRKSQHVSLAAWGVGSALEYNKIETQNFLKTLKEIVRKQSALPTYLGLSIIAEDILLEDAADFIIFEGYGKEPNDFLNIVKQFEARHFKKPFVVTYGYPLFPEARHLMSFSFFSDSRQSEVSSVLSTQVALQEMQAFKLQRVLLNVELEQQVAGVFIHTYADWPGNRPNLIFGATENSFLNRSGLVSLNREKRLGYEVVRSAFTMNKKLTVPDQSAINHNPSVYPLLGLALIILFLFNFNRSRKFRGNLRRIFLYPHGFYTEILDKRKIPMGHTFLLSFIMCTVISIVLSSILYKFRNDLLLNEILDLLIGSNSIKLQIIRLIWRPIIFILIISVLFYLITGFMLVIFRFISFVLGQNLPISQLFTLIFWASANLVWFLPVIPVYFRLVNKTNWTLPVIFLFLLFIVWSLTRISRGLIVVFRLTVFKAVIFVIILSALTLGGLGWYYDSSRALFDYIPLYWSFVESNYF